MGGFDQSRRPHDVAALDDGVCGVRSASATLCPFKIDFEDAKNNPKKEVPGFSRCIR